MADPTAYKPCDGDEIFKFEAIKNYLQDQLLKVCDDGSGRILSGKIESESNGRSILIDCDAEYDRVARYEQGFDEAIKAIKAGQTPMCPTDCGLCVEKIGASEIQPYLDKIPGYRAFVKNPDLMKKGREIADLAKPECTDIERERRALSACLNPMVPKPPGEQATWSSCWDKVKAGFTGNIKSLWDGAKLAANLAKQSAVAAKNSIVGKWKSFWNVQDAQSDATVIAAQQKENEIREIQDNQQGWLEKIFHLADNLVRENFTCREWVGEGADRQCVNFVRDWGCVTCGQRADAVCGVAGFLVGEIATAMIGGAAIGAAFKTVATAARGTAFMAKGIGKAVAPATTARAINATRAARLAHTMSWASFRGTEAYKTWVQAPRVVFKVTRRTAQRGLLVKVAWTPVFGNYLRLLSYAGECGFKLGSNPGSILNKAVRKYDFYEPFVIRGPSP